MTDTGSPTKPTGSGTGPRLYFDRAEFGERLAKVRRAMAKRDIALLVVSDPSNMAWITGYDSWSFYVHQCVLVTHDQDPLWFGRGQDATGARRTVYMSADRIVGYPDDYVQSSERHPMDLLSEIIADRRWGSGIIGLEMDNYYFSATAADRLKHHLEGATFVDATGLVNWQRAVKSPRELDYMRRAARIVEATYARILELVEPGMSKNRIVAEIYKCSIDGVDGIGGDYPAIVPLLSTGADGAAPHLTWDDAALERDAGTFFEIAGCYRRYHCPLSRTVYLGAPPQTFRDAEQALVEAIAVVLEAARPGMCCEDIHTSLQAVLQRYGLSKDSRCGYSIGLSYPPDWGERTMSLRAGDCSVLEPGMTFHFMPGLWFDDWGIEMSESIVITDGGCEPLARVPRQLFIKD